MHAAALEVKLHLPQVHSLKEKRGVVRPIVDGCRRRFNVAAAEVGQQDMWQSAELGVSAIGSSEGHVGQVLDAVERFIWSFPEVEVISCERSWWGS
jgi:uncharacterized protein YlxP (DUF503 family)